MSRCSKHIHKHAHIQSTNGTHRAYYTYAYTVQDGPITSMIMCRIAKHLLQHCPLLEQNIIDVWPRKYEPRDEGTEHKLWPSSI